MIIIYLCIFFLGASLASFLNATVYRLEQGYKYPKIVMLNSHCEKCKKPLNWKQLIPILGYIFYKGKCPKCKSVVSIYYPISELILGTIFLIFYLSSIPLFFYIIILFLFVLSFYDYLSNSIPKNLVHIFIGICLIFFFFFNFNLENIYLPLIVCGVLLLVNIFKKSFGLGDILLLFSIGILQSFGEFLVTFWLAILIALLYSLIFVVKKKIDIKKAKIPMVPFISLAFSISVLYGENIYSQLLKWMGIW